MKIVIDIDVANKLNAIPLDVPAVLAAIAAGNVYLPKSGVLNLTKASSLRKCLNYRVEVDGSYLTGDVR